MSNAWVVNGKNATALFTLKLHRGEGMALLAMNWKDGTPPDNFVGFAIEYKEPGGDAVLPAQEPARLPRERRLVQPERALDAAVPDPEVPLGPLSRETRSSPGEFTYQVDAGVHGQPRRA